MLKFDFPNYAVPPDRLRFTAPTGHKIVEADRTIWYTKIRKHYQDNSIPIPEDLDRVAQDQLCRILPPGWCRHESGEGYAGLNTRLELADYLHGTRVLAEIALASDPLVEQELAESRGAKCAACPANIFVPGCAPCVGISNLVVGIKGAKTTKADGFLKTCAICKCNNEAQVWIKPEILAKGVDGTQLAQMRDMPDCWKVKELEA